MYGSPSTLKSPVTPVLRRWPTSDTRTEGARPVRAIPAPPQGLSSPASLPLRSLSPLPPGQWSPLPASELPVQSFEAVAPAAAPTPARESCLLPTTSRPDTAEDHRRRVATGSPSPVKSKKQPLPSEIVRAAHANDVEKISEWLAAGGEVDAKNGAGQHSIA